MSGLVDTTAHNENHLDCFFNPTETRRVEKGNQDDFHYELLNIDKTGALIALL